MSFRILKVGGDPEFFLADRETGNIVSAVGTIPGKKGSPYNLPDGSGAIQRDNVMVELNIIPASSTAEFVENTSGLVESTAKFVEDHGLVLSTDSVVTMEQRYIDTIEAQEIGCASDICARTFNETSSATARRLGNVRTAGGHIHVEYSGNISPEELVMYMDYYITLPLIAAGVDTCGSRRRRFYGKAGRFRFTSYGLEYRTPDNGWALNRDALWAVADRLFHLYRWSNPYSLSGISDEEVVKAINTGNVRRSQELCDIIGASFHLDNPDYPEEEAPSEELLEEVTNTIAW